MTLRTRLSCALGSDMQNALWRIYEEAAGVGTENSGAQEEGSSWWWLCWCCSCCWRWWWYVCLRTVQVLVLVLVLVLFAGAVGI
jgi:hypothetical protein